MAFRKNVNTSEDVFTLTLPLRCEPWQRDRLDKLFRCCNNVKNALISRKLNDLKQMERTKAWHQVQVQLAYAIGVAQPVSLRVDSYGTGTISDEKMTALLRRICDLTPAGIINKLQLRRPIYAPTAAEGHFGVADRPWEQTDLVPLLQQLATEI